MQSKIKIKATKEEVWNALTDFNKFPIWNPFIISISGKLEIGSQLNVNIKPPNGKKMTFKPKLVTLEENVELTWLGRFLFRGILDGKHTFKIIEKDEGSVEFIHRERFSGVLLFFLGRKFMQNTKSGFEEMNLS
ncbi:SRPBCC domain-containing protein [Brumimicrobium aurantiacum]|uniref:SRPBCC domain-containing protein n=1 Tax=Brumimicrobium aurantiacum TaxID=1737063 RepID=A0A3E1F285_9FLAO|nr:SRPBCC domain-containing protein [Brumimicrobium aurantiacum]